MNCKRNIYRYSYGFYFHSFTHCYPSFIHPVSIVFYTLILNTNSSPSIFPIILWSLKIMTTSALQLSSMFLILTISFVFLSITYSRSKVWLHCCLLISTLQTVTLFWIVFCSFFSQRFSSLSVCQLLLHSCNLAKTERTSLCL